HAEAESAMYCPVVSNLTLSNPFDFAIFRRSSQFSARPRLAQ
ncbi:hypothetical protein JCM11641_005815, partial [Rhodosporidiobolus odoratus]